ncbi:MAG: hypothetical protein ACUVTZ_09235 [Armatimonadota bacterium]
MRCRRVMALLAKVGREDELPEPARAHLEQCVKCAAQSRLLERAEALLRAVEPVDEPPFFTERFLARLERERARRCVTAGGRMQAFLTPSRRWKLWLAAALAAAHLLASAPFSRIIVNAPEAGARYTAEIAPRVREGVVSFAKELLGVGSEGAGEGGGRRSWLYPSGGRGLGQAGV